MDLFPRRSASSGIVSDKSACVLLLSSSLVLFTWSMINWKVKRDVKELADQVQKMVRDGPMINKYDKNSMTKILNAGFNRAMKWMSLQHNIEPIHEARPLLTQVGGHGASLQEASEGFLSLAPDYVLKPLQSANRGLREVAFYEALKMAEDSKRDLVPLWLAIFDRGHIISEADLAQVASYRRMRKEINLLRRLSNFTASYYGVVSSDSNSAAPSSSSYLLLNDLTMDYSKPCVLDLKMGRQTYEPDASKTKKSNEINKYPQQLHFGFRIAGMRVYDPSNSSSDLNGFMTFSSRYGTTLHLESEVLNAFRLFFKHTQQRSNSPEKNLSQIRPRRDSSERTIQHLLYALHSIQRWFEENDMLCFKSSSLLIMYEGDMGQNDRIDAKMIDFGHVRRDSNGDKGFLYGLKMLTNLLNLMLSKPKKLETVNDLTPHQPAGIAGTTGAIADAENLVNEFLPLAS